MISTKKTVCVIVFGILVLAGIATVMASMNSGHTTTARHLNEFSANGKIATPHKNHVYINNIHITAGLNKKLSSQTRVLGATAGLRINNNSELQSMAINESWHGNGSASNPYMIENISIDANGGSSGLYIGNVTEHIIISNVSINDTLGYSNDYYHGAAIELYNTSNVQVDNITANNSQIGIALMTSHNVTIKNCSNINNAAVYGIELYKSENITLINNTFYKTSGNFSAIAIIYSTNNTLYDNSMTDNTIYVWGNKDTFTTQTIPSNNTVNGGYVYYYKNGDISNVTFPAYATEIILGNVTNARISNATLASVDVGYSQNITVTNNQMEFSKLAIYIEGVNNTTISNNNCSDSEVGIAMYNSENATIQNNQIYTTYWDTAIYLNESYNVTVLQNHITNAYYDGIDLDQCSKDLVENNTVYYSGYQGIQLRYSTNSTISDNMLINNNNNGIYMYHSTENIIQNNNASFSKYYHGISIDSSNNNTILENSMWYNNYQGIWMGYSSGNVISENKMIGNVYNGIFMYYSSNNIIRDNNASENQQYHGISINYGDYNILNNNTLFNNGGDGIYIYTSNSAEIFNNSIINNTLYGIDIASGSYNLIYNNSFYYNNGSNGTYNSSHIQAYDNGYDNYWNTSTRGNYWYDWANNNNTNDQNNDGIVDWPYAIGGSANSTDYLPLKESTVYVPEFSNIAILLPLLVIGILAVARRKIEDP